MAGASFLAIIPPPAVVEAVVRIQQAVGAYDATWPHITVKAQPGLGDDGAWVAAVEEAIASVPRFDLALTGVGWFGDGIVYVAADGPIQRLHEAILDAVDAERWEYEGEAFVPHRSVAAGFLGATEEQLRLAAELVAAGTWPSFTVEAVVELHRDADDQPYRPARGFLLST